MVLAFIVYFLTCLTIFFVSYTFIFGFFKNKIEAVKANIYIIIPLYCIICWALYYAAIVNFLSSDYVSYDFTNYYYCGERVIKKPRDLYRKNIDHDVIYGYKYLPNFAVIIGVPLYLLIPTITLAYKIFFIINIILGIIFMILFNKVLYLMNLKKKLYRFMFLIVISNGWLVLQQYRHNQTKYLLGVIILFILKRELQYKKKQIEKDFKYNLIHYNLFIFIVGSFPYFIFYILIIIFQDIPKNEIFKKDNLKKYFFLIILFIGQNFLFILYPDLIFKYYEVYQIENRRFGDKFAHFYLLFFDAYLDKIPKIYRINFIIALNIILIAIAFGLIFVKKLKLEEKLGFMSLSILFLNYVAYRISLILLPLICLLLVPFLSQKQEGANFIKKNKFVLGGLFANLGIYLIPHKDQFGYPYIEGITLTFFFLIIILAICIFLLYIKKNKFIEKEESQHTSSNFKIYNKN